MHHRLDAILADHEVALVRGDFPLAKDTWRQFTVGLGQHADDEEQHLFPVYAERVPIPQGGTVELYLAEHKKIRAFLHEIGERVERLGDSPEPAAIIELIEREYELKRLLEHHDMREKSFLYPLLDQYTSPDERQTLLAIMK